MEPPADFPDDFHGIVAALRARQRYWSTHPYTDPIIMQGQNYVQSEVSTTGSKPSSTGLSQAINHLISITGGTSMSDAGSNVSGPSITVTEEIYRRAQKAGLPSEVLAALNINTSGSTNAGL